MLQLSGFQARVVSGVFLSFLLSMNVASAKEDVPPNINGATTVDAEQVIDLIDEHENLVLFDSRKPSDHAKGFIEGSVAMPDTDTTPDALAKHVDSKSTPIIFYCNGVKCGRSVKATQIAVDAGYTNIYWFRGGWEEWVDKGYPVAH